MPNIKYLSMEIDMPSCQHRPSCYDRLCRFSCAIGYDHNSDRLWMRRWSSTIAIANGSRCGCDPTVIWPWCDRDSVRCDHDPIAIWPRSNHNPTAIRPWSNRDLAMIWPWHDHDTKRWCYCAFLVHTYARKIPTQHIKIVYIRFVTLHDVQCAIVCLHR